MIAPRSHHAAVVLFAAAVAVTACGDRVESPAPAPAPGSSPPSAGVPANAADRSAADASYTIRGRLTRLPQPGDSLREINVSHESIPDFKGPQGDVVGMMAMTMPFEVAPEVALEGLAVGDAVTMTLEMRWGNSPTALITTISELPEGTVLAFEEPEPAAAETAAPVQ